MMHTLLPMTVCTPYFSTGIALLCACAALLTSQSYAQRIANPILPEQAKEEFVILSHEAYWEAIDNGAYGQYEPSENEQRDKLLIPKDHALRIIDNAAPVGVAMWCGVDWQPYYLEYMAMERRVNGWDIAQNRYVGVLFGFTQSAVHKDFEQSKQPTCSSELRTKTLELMKASEQTARSML